VGKIDTVSGDKVFGTLDNEPVFLRNIALGEKVTVELEEIEELL
jgi:uncharacterized protein YegJ (DUF2314 family)